MKTFIYDILSYYKPDDCDFEMDNDSFLDGYVPNSQLMRFSLFVRVSSKVCDFNNRNKCLTAQLLKQGYQYHHFLNYIRETRS